jgi:hypothetical protein
MVAILDRHMQGHQFIVGDGMTIAECVTAYLIDRANEQRLIEGARHCVISCPDLPTPQRAASDCRSFRQRPGANLVVPSAVASPHGYRRGGVKQPPPARFRAAMSLSRVNDGVGSDSDHV